MHEAFHVFGDRLVNDRDRTVVVGFIRELTRSVFSYDFESLFRHLDENHDGIVELSDLTQLMFGPIDMSASEATNASASDGLAPTLVYDEILAPGMRTSDDTSRYAGTREPGQLAVEASCTVSLSLPPPPLSLSLSLMYKLWLDMVCWRVCRWQLPQQPRWWC